MLGSSAAPALWALESGKGIAGLDRDAKLELSRLRGEVDRLSQEREQAVSMHQGAEIDGELRPLRGEGQADQKPPLKLTTVNQG